MCTPAMEGAPARVSMCLGRTHEDHLSKNRDRAFGVATGRRFATPTAGKGADRLRSVPVEQAKAWSCADIHPHRPRRGTVRLPHGAVSEADDIPTLLRLGKVHIDVWTCRGAEHEDDRRARIARAVAGEHGADPALRGPHQPAGDRRGLLKIRRTRCAGSIPSTK